MALPFSRDPQVRDELALRREQAEFRRKQAIRQRDIAREVTIGVEGAVRNVKNPNSFVNKPHEIVHLHHWKPKSPMYIMEYGKIEDDEARNDAVRADIESLEETVKALQKRFREYKIQVSYSSKNDPSRYPNQILVSR